MEKKYSRSDILYIFVKILFSTIFSFTLFLDSKLSFVQELRAGVDKIHFNKATPKDYCVFIFAWIISFLIITLIEKIMELLKDKVYKKENKEKKKYVYFIIVAVLLIAWLPYVLTYFPGGIFSDTQRSLMQCLHIRKYDNANPFAYTMLLKIFLGIGDIFQSAQVGIDAFSIFQTISMAFILAYFPYWMYKKNFSNVFVILVTAFFAIFKLIPMYAVSIWKDTIFSLLLFIYVLEIIKIVDSNGKNLKSWKEIIKFCIITLAVCLFRNNGFYVAFATNLFIILVYRKEKIIKFSISTIITIILAYAIIGPLYNVLGINDPTSRIGWNAVKINQIFYTKVTNGNITPEQDELINQMCKEYKLKEAYAPFLMDATTINPEFNDMFIKMKKKEIDKLWLELFKQNPKAYVDAYLLNTLGFWDVNRAFPDAYISNFMWPDTESFIDVHQTDLIEDLTGKSIGNIIQVKKLYSSAIFLFITLLSMVLTIYKKNYKSLLIYLPSIFTWGTIVLATPIAFSMRYVYILVLMTPIDFIIPLLDNNGIKNDERKK